MSPTKLGLTEDVSLCDERSSAIAPNCSSNNTRGTCGPSRQTDTLSLHYQAQLLRNYVINCKKLTFKLPGTRIAVREMVWMCPGDDKLVAMPVVLEQTS